MPFTVEELHAALRELDSVRYGANDLQTAVERIVGATHDLFSVDGAALMLLDDQLTLRNAACSDERLDRLEDLQVRHGAGPGIEAFDAKTLVGSDDLGAEQRWPSFAEEAVGAGVRALLASPIPFAEDAIGVVLVFSSTPHAWTPEGELALTAFTDLAALAILLGLQSVEQGALASQLQSALDHRVVVEQAKGVLVGAEGCSPRDALQRLRAEARSHRRRLADVAADVLAAAQLGRPTPSSGAELGEGGSPQ